MKILDIKRNKKGQIIRVWAKHRIKRKCIFCGNNFETVESRIKDGKGKFCSKSCFHANGISKSTRELWSKQRKGKRNSPKTEFKFKNGNGYRHLLLKGVLNQKCEKCGYKGNIKRLHVHHIDHNRKNNSIKNLKVLCRPCHLMHHGKKERKYVEGAKAV